MFRREVYSSWRCLAFFLVLFIPHSSFGQANFIEPGLFVITNECEAYSSLKKRKDPFALVVGDEYFAYAENKPAGSSHVYLEAGGKRRWANLNCGRYVNGRPPLKDGNGDNDGLQCLPFFDDIENPVAVGVGGDADITPVPPELDAFDKAVNTMCGSAGKRTSRHEFKQLLRQHPQVFAEIREFTGGKVFFDQPERTDAESYLDDLAEAWYAIHAFDHIFCGEPVGNSVGGLHFHGRYWQLQQSGELCRLANHRKNEVVPGSVYTMGLKMKRASSGWASHETKGYGYTLNARDILMAVTRAFTENPTDSSSSTGCLLDLADGEVNYTTVFVRRAKGIRTFYPDATPDRNRNPSCSESIALGETTVSPLCGAGADPSILKAGQYRIMIKSSDRFGFDLRVEKCE